MPSFDDDLIIELDDRLIVVPPKNHNELQNLGFEESGHTGFTPSILSLLGNVGSDTANANFYIVGNVNNVAKKMTLADLITRVIKTADELPNDLQEGQYLFQKTTGNNYQLYKVGANSELIAIHPETSADNIVETNEKKVMTAQERTKLNGIENGAQVNTIEGIKVNGVIITPDGEKIVNIPMPTDVGADLSYNATTGVLSLVDKNGNVLGSVDLPLELLIQSGYYDSTNREIVLVLANNTPQVPSQIRIPVGDLVDVYTGDNVNIEVDSNNVIKFTQAFLTRIATIETSFQAKAIEKTFGDLATNIIQFTQDECNKIENGALVIVTYTSDNTKHTFVPYKKDSNGITLLNDEEFSVSTPLTYTKLSDLPNYETITFDPTETYYRSVGGEMQIYEVTEGNFERNKSRLYIGATFGNPKVYKKQLGINLFSLAGTITNYELLFNSKQDALVSGTNIKTINGVSILGSGDIAINSDLHIEKTYAELKALRDNSQLVKGMQYRITDYQCTTTQAETQSANNQFDIIVVADDVNKLNENARAVKHSGDTYFANSKLEAWELKYCLDNDITRFDWADTTNGKGVIYYMKDEFNNECPYDFKNIQFARYNVTSSPSEITGIVGVKRLSTFFPSDSTYDETKYWFYTFDYNGIDKSLTNVVDNNKIAIKYYNNKISLNNIVFKGVNVSSNIFNNGNGEMTFSGNSIYNNFFETSCSGNISISTFADNKFGRRCFNNTFKGETSGNTFGRDFSYNKFKGSFFLNNIFGNGCQNNEFQNLQQASIDSKCTFITASSIRWCIIETDCSYLNISSSNNVEIHNLHICLGVGGTSTLNKLSINVPDNYLSKEEIVYKKNNSTEVFVE